MRFRYSRHDFKPFDWVVFNARSSPSRVTRAPLTASVTEVGPTLPVDPFDGPDGGGHHRSPMRMAQRLRELERENVRLLNIISNLRDEDYAKQAANCGAAGHQWSSRDEGIQSCKNCGLLAGHR